MLSSITNRRSRWLAGLVIFVGALSGAAVVYGIAVNRHSPEAGDRPIARIEPHAFDFGEVLPGSDFKARCLVSNDGSQVLEISNLRTSCGCAPASIDKTQLRVGETAVVTVNFHVPLHAGAVDHRVFFDTNDPERRSLSIPLHVQARWPVEAAPVSLHFGSIAKGTKQTRALELYSTAADPLDVGSITPSASWICVERGKAEPRRIRFAVNVEPPEIGNFTGTVRFETNSQSRPTIMVPLEGEVVGTSHVSPRRILLGQVAPGSSAELRLELDGSPTLESVSIEDPAWTVIGHEYQRTQPDAAGLAVTVRLPSESGYHRCVMRLKPSDAAEVVEVPVSAFVTR